MGKLKNKDLISLKDLTKAEIYAIFQTTDLIKQKDFSFQPLKGKTVGLLFEKPSCRTRVSFEVAIYKLGGNSVYLSSSEIQLKKRELIKDVAKTLSQYLDGIILRTFLHQDIIEFAQFASIPVINGLSDFSHPCQILADLYTILKIKKKLENLKIVFIGDGNNNVCHSWLFAAKILNLNFVVATPLGYQPSEEEMNFVFPLSKQKIEITNQPCKAVENADVIYTDVWISMGQEKESKKRKEVFKKFQVNKNLIQKAKKDVIIMHCLPAHREEEITSEVIDGKNSYVFEQAKNRLDVQKAILTLLL